MKTPKKKEVVKYFENAETIKTAIKVVKVNKKGFYFNNDMFWHKDENGYKGIVWDSKEGYAKILSYKEPKEKTYKITREQIKEIHGHSKPYGEIERKLKEWFPEVFETKLPNCFTGWVLDEKYPKVIAYSENGFLKYGFDANGNWIEGTNTKLLNEREATEQEVTEALIKEAVKVGYKQGIYIVDVYNGESEKDIVQVSSNVFQWEPIGAGINAGQMALRDSDGNIIFHNGKFAEIIQTLTIQEAEAKLNCKIV